MELFKGGEYGAEGYHHEQAYSFDDLELPALRTTFYHRSCAQPALSLVW